MATHIALLGRTKEVVLKPFQVFPISSLYVLHSSDEKEFNFKGLATEIKADLTRIGFTSTNLFQINPFDMNSIVSSIISIVDKEKGQVFINITGGTNLMAASACTAAFFVGAKAYYVMGRKDKSEFRIIELPVPNIPYYRALEATQLNVLSSINKLGGMTTGVMLRDTMEISPQRLGYHIKQLEIKGLVETSRLSGRAETQRDRRIISISLTNAGRFILQWTGLN